MSRPVIGEARRYEPVRWRTARSVEEAFGPGARLHVPRESVLERLARAYVNAGPEGPVAVALAIGALIVALLIVAGAL